MEYLKFIGFGDTGIKEVPSSIRYLIGHIDLRLYLNLSGCSKLAKFTERVGAGIAHNPTNSTKMVAQILYGCVSMFHHLVSLRFEDHEKLWSPPGT